MARLARAGAALLAACPLAACEAQENAAQAQRPHFAGRIKVTLRTGREIYGLATCAPSTARVCAPVRAAVRPTLREAQAEATRSGAYVLVAGQDQQVLMTAPVTRIEGRHITFANLAQPEAWDLVEAFDQA